MKRFYKILKYSFYSVASLLFLLFLLLQFTGVQKQIANFVKEKVLIEQGLSEIEFERIRLGLSGKIILYNLSIPDDCNGQLVSIEKIKIKIKLYSLFKKEIFLQHVLLKGVSGNVYQYKNNSFNFSNLILSKNSTSKAKPKSTEDFSFEVGKVILEDIQFRYHDSISQVFLDVNLGYFATNLHGSDIANLNFYFNKINLKNTNVVLGIDKSLVPNKSEKTNNKQALPFFKSGAINLNNVNFRLNDIAKSSYLEAVINELYGKEILVDIDKELVDVEFMRLKNSAYTMNYIADTIIEERAASTLIDSSESINFSGGWTILAESVEGKNNSVLLQLEESKDSLHVFHGTNFGFEKINFSIEKTSIQHNQIKSNIKSVSCTDSKSFQLIDAAIDFTMNKNLGFYSIHKLNTNLSNISAEFDIDYPLLNAKPENLQIRQVFMKGSLSINEIAYFLPNIENVKNYIGSNNLDVNININGDKDNIEIQQFELSSNNNFFLKAKGDIYNYTHPRKISYNISVDTMELESLSQFELFKSEKFHNNLPSISAKLNIRGTIDSLSGKLNLSDKIASLNTEISIKKNNKELLSELVIKTKNLNVSRYMRDTLLGEIYGRIKVQGVLGDSNKLQALWAEGIIFSLDIAGTQINNVLFDGSYKNSYLSFKSSHSSDNLDYTASIDGLLLADSIDLNYSLQIGNVNATHYGLLKNNLNISTKLAGEFTFLDSKKFSITSKIDDINIEYKDKDYALNKIQFIYKELDGFEYINLETEGFKIDLKKNISSNEAKNEFKKLLISSIKPGIKHMPDKGQECFIYCNINSPTAIQHLLNSALFDTLDIESLNFECDLQKNKLELDLNVPQVCFDGVNINNIESKILIGNNSIHSNLKFNKIAYKNISSNFFEFDIFNNVKGINYIVKLADKTGKFATNIPVIMSYSDSILKFKLNPDSVLISNNIWETNNKIAIQYNFKSKHWASEGVGIYYENQSIEFIETPTEVIVTLKDLDLKNISHFFTVSDTNYITNGNLSAILLLKNEGSSANVSIEDIHFLSTPYGNIYLNFNKLSDENQKLSLSVINKNDYLKYEGSFGNLSKKEHSAHISISDLSVYSELIDTSIINLKEGQLKAEINTIIKNEGLLLAGFVDMSNLLVHVPQIGAQYKIVDERFIFDNKGIHFSKINIEDMAENKLVLDGNILTENYSDFKFDLTIKSDYFQIFNTLEEQNQDIYGQLIISTNIALKGTSDEPAVKANITVHEKTDFTFTLPGDDPLQSDNQDVVRFIDVSVTDSDSLYIVNSLTSVSDSIGNLIKQGKLNLIVNFNPLARFKIITNPISGDYAYFGLNGAFAYRTIQNGITDVTGNIQIVDGFYKMSFYDMIKKDFTIEPQSTIYFSGPISNTTLDIKAKNIVRTNSLALMSSESIGNSPEEKALYNQRLPYELYFVVEGLLLSPEVSFELDLPNEYKQSSPMIASKLNKLAGSEMEQERNMQVFALLVTGGFIAENTGVTSGSGSSDVAATTARNSVNSILSQQLNKLTSDKIKYFDMNLGLNTYEDYARRGGSTTTDLDVQISKSLFDDKLNFEMESRINLDATDYPGQSKSNYNTDYKLFYKIDELGRYKLKAYNLSTYDLFDGDITNTGLGIVFSKDFGGKKKKNYVETDSVQVND